MLCELPAVCMYLLFVLFLFFFGVPVCSGLGWCLVLRGVGVDSAVLVSIFAGIR
jgi:hypothetical protein